MERGRIEAMLDEWLATARRLEYELGQPEPDEGAVRELLAQRRRLQEELAARVGRGAPVRSELQLLARACVEADRRAEAQARARLAESAQALSQVRGQRAAADGYRRALVEATRNGVTFFDGRI